MASPPSLVSVIALVLVIVLMFAVLILYIIYFLNRDISSEYGSEWEFVSVSDTDTEIRPNGHQVLSANGGSSSRGSNPDFLYIGKPKNTPYIRRIFIIYNNSENAQLELRSDGINFQCENNGQLFIDQQTGMLFIWRNSDTLIPVVIGGSANS